MSAWRIMGYRSFVTVLAAMLGLFLGLSGYTFLYAQGYSYMLDDPKVCVNCHIMREQYDSWLKSSHHGAATCNDCHIPSHGISKWIVKAENGFWHSKAFTLQDFHEPIRIRPHNGRVLQSNCIRCHGPIVGEVLAHEGEPDDQVPCVRCHVEVGHGAVEAGPV